MVAPRKTSIDRSLTDAGDKMGDEDDAIRQVSRRKRFPVPALYHEGDPDADANERGSR
jgi:hypothetical protein